jgi:RNA polymerase sigma-70 factor (ECF subfamily)
MTESDHELMQQCRRGDSAAFERLVRRWEKPVAGILVRLVGSRAQSSRTPLDAVPGSANGRSEIEDLSQDVFVRVLAARDRYRNTFAFSTWLYRIVLNVARDAARRRRTRWKRLISHRPALHSETPPEVVGQKEVEQLIAEAISALPSQLREPLVLRHFAERTFAEVAQVMNLPLSTVKSRVQTALLKLRAELKNRGIDERELEP